MRFWHWLLGHHRYYTLHPDALGATEVTALRDAILASTYMSVNNLNQRFEGTYGFSVVFRRDSLEAVLAEFPAFGPYLSRALRPECNAFFLNPLLIADGGGVKPHRDFSLNAYVADAGCPAAVSVLYVEVPGGLKGGELRLFGGDRPVATLAPRPRALLTFKGDLRHEVLPVSSGAPDIYEARLSLVVEQYRLTDVQLAAVPACHIGTRRPEGAKSQPLADGVGEGAFGDELRRWLN